MRVREFLLVFAVVACLGLWVYPRASPEPTKRQAPTSSPPPPTRATVEVSVESRPDALKDVKIEVECTGSEEFEVGFHDGRPVAFFTLDRDDSAICGYVTSVHHGQRYSPPEIQTVDRLNFTLTSADFTTYGADESILTAKIPDVWVNVSVYVWIDGEWQAAHTELEPVAEGQGIRVRKVRVNSPEPPGLALDSAYRLRLSQTAGSQTWD